MKAGIIGLPQVGTTSFLKILTKARIEADTPAQSVFLISLPMVLLAISKLRRIRAITA